MSHPHVSLGRALTVAAPLLTGMDWMQTLDIARHPHDYRELNPLLGAHPSQAAVNRYMALSTLGALGIPAMLPKKLRTPARALWTAIELGNVLRNRAIGIGLELP